MTTDVATLPTDGPPCLAGASEASPDSRRTRLTFVVTSAVFVSLVALDTLEPATYVTGSWWLVLLIVWVMPWPGRRLSPSAAPRVDTNTALSVLSVIVVGWLYYRAASSIVDTAFYIEFVDVEGKLRAINFVLQDLATGVLTAALLAWPLQRTFGRDSTAVAFVTATPWFVLTCSDTVFDIGRWYDRPFSNALWLFEATILPLLLMQACALLARRSTQATTPSPLRGSSPYERLSVILDRCPPWFAGSAAQPLLLLTLCAFALRFYVDDMRSLSPAASFAVLAVTPLCGLLLTVAMVHELRRRRTRRNGLNRWARLRTQFEASVSALILAPLWLWILFVDAPLVDHYARESLAALAGPAWTIDYQALNQTLSLSGEYQYGVAAAFADALELHPDTRRIELSGPGGRLDEGMAIAHAIESRDLDTYVQSECVSACTLAFLAGRHRTLLEDALLGFHAVSFPTSLLDHEDDNEYSRYLTVRGVDVEFIQRAAETPSDDMWYPTNERLRNAGVLTAIE